MKRIFNIVVLTNLIAVSAFAAAELKPSDDLTAANQNRIDQSQTKARTCCENEDQFTNKPRQVATIKAAADRAGSALGQPAPKEKPDSTGSGKSQ